MIEMQMEFPSLIKYMGSKTGILEFIEFGINKVHSEDQDICDLFSGSATLSGALRGQVNIISNDIQSYSEILSKTYLSEYDWSEYPQINELCDQALERVNRFHKQFSQFHNKFNYNREFDLKSFNLIEREQQMLIDFDEFKEFDNYYLFTKYYSGTYWSYEQCLWIDSIKFIADKYRYIEPLYVAIMSSLMFAMAYNSQSTGHYAQYRDANTISSMNDILIYRRKNIKDMFERKLTELKYSLKENQKKFITYSLDFEECLDKLSSGTLVYADPPYGMVHYSRFYHAIETLVKYDYPEVNYKGRYREDRHQSPFCIRKKVSGAFRMLFHKIRENNLEIVLSYSNSDTNTISLEHLLSIACMELNKIGESLEEKIEEDIKSIIYSKLLYSDENILTEDRYKEIIITDEMFFNKYQDSVYEISFIMAKHNHSTMGRRIDRTIPVKEILIIGKIR